MASWLRRDEFSWIPLREGLKARPIKHWVQNARAFAFFFNMRTILGVYMHWKGQSPPEATGTLGQRTMVYSANASAFSTCPEQERTLISDQWRDSPYWMTALEHKFQFAAIWSERCSPTSVCFALRFLYVFLISCIIGQFCWCKGIRSYLL